MSNATATMRDNGILLSAGTNELEVLVFQVAGQRFGVNVAKVREILSISDLTTLPAAHPSIEGVVKVREIVVSLVNLTKHLFGDTAEFQATPTDQMLLLEFSQQMIGFRVQSTERIYRLSWNDVVPVPEVPGIDSPITSLIQLQGSIVSLLDFESIVEDFVTHEPATIGDSGHSGAGSDIRDMPILYADDSKLLRTRIQNELTRAGFTNTKGFEDGADAWNYLRGLADQGSSEPISNHVAALITDIEMPRMDGLTLTNNLRKTPLLASLPVVVFSSIASKDNEKKAAQVGASAQVSKPRFGELVSAVSKLLAEVAC